MHRQPIHKTKAASLSIILGQPISSWTKGSTSHSKRVGSQSALLPHRVLPSASKIWKASISSSSVTSRLSAINITNSSKSMLPDSYLQIRSKSASDGFAPCFSRASANSDLLIVPSPFYQRAGNFFVLDIIMKIPSFCNLEMFSLFAILILPSNVGVIS